MLFDVAVVRDNGDTWIVDYLTKSDFTTSDIGEKYVRVSAMAAKEIRVAKENGCTVLLPKDYITEITPGQVFTHQEDKLQYAKNKACYEVSSVVNPVLETLSFVDRYAFIAIHDKFASRGIFITDENVDKIKELFESYEGDVIDKDEAYINIIRSKVKEDYEDLEIYVDARDKMKRAYDIFKDIKKTVLKIRSAETVDDVEKTKNDFLHRFNFPGM